MIQQDTLFTPDVQSRAHLRQNSRCALCGVSLVWGQDSPLAVIPIPGGRRQAIVGDWRLTEDNCVILCNGCYIWSDDDIDRPSGAPTLPEDYKFSHGSAGSGSHREWVTKLMGRT